ncbi:hypothetical protein NQT74_14595 [Alteromonas stellipolaris]|uniref:hypothetical protein n=1 Tax=Alteromonas stellipolaris TaxID=233316 RepID=UPI002118838F|nr:hypothetical protein [Alteromonas stellipolaris]MCQ8849813.1 hypothetical protein [Alteromonas stellipolaris]
MDKDKLKELIEKHRANLIRRSTAYLNPSSKEHENSLHSYKVNYGHLMQADLSVGYSADFSADNYPSFEQFQISLIYPEYDPIPSEYASNEIYSILPKTDMGAVEQPWLQFDKDVVETTSELRILFSKAKEIKNLLHNGNIHQAINVLDTLENTKVREEKVSFVDADKPLNDAVDEYLEAGKLGKLSPLSGTSKRKPWNGKIYENNYRNTLMFRVYFEGCNISDIGSNELEDFFRDVVFNFPNNTGIYHSSKVNFEQKTHIAIAGDVDEKFLRDMKSGEEVKKTLQGFYNYLRYSRVIQSTPMAGFTIKFSNSIQKRAKFTDHLVRKILNFCNMLDDDNKKWPPIIMAFTGMRNGEVMQLRKMDIKQDADTGIQYIHVSGDAGSVKNKSAIRQIPIHEELIERGFLDFVETKSTNLFNKDSKFLTRFFSNIIRRECEIPKEDDHKLTYNLYSFRHSFNTKLRNGCPSPDRADQIMGHSSGGSRSEGRTTYMHDMSIEDKLKDVNQVRYVIKGDSTEK